MSLPPFPDALVSTALAEGDNASVALPEDAWDMVGLGSADVSQVDKEHHIKNGQVSLLSGADQMTSKEAWALEQRESYRLTWKDESEDRLAKLEAKKSLLEKAEETGLRLRKFTWQSDNHKAFEWRKIYHALVNTVGGLPDGGIASETVISPTAMRMYTDHRVMGAIVLPGVSHVSCFAATGSLGFPNPGGVVGDWHMSIKEVLFERPYIVNSGEEIIAATAAGADSGSLSGGAMQAAVGVPMTYCRCTSVTKEKGQISPKSDWIS